MVTLNSFFDVAKPFLVFILVFALYFIIQLFLKKKLLRSIKTKRMKHNITIFTNILTYLFIIISALVIIFYFTGNIFSIGITAGLLTAALGWALQRPITGVAAWIMVVISKPFSIGDRIIIGGVKGDVINITLTHVYLKEFGGTTGGEETSGRVIMVPNSLLFEKEVINYTFEDDFILDEILITVTYESNIDKAKQICLSVVEKLTKEFENKVQNKPYLRLSYQPSGIDIKLRYYVPASKRQEFNSNITEETFKQISKEKSVEIAYPHTEVIFRKK